ncbi:UDP-glycosyltransferase UGT5-like [Schistocerca serialis cubense]|uniref:UDP-glycosyltransferase UGT5-like n=1 Tax=Schistocerca serialis cubense TaxID=2023355 RepID=UPI00214E78B5|nr:UDP-glycosyltransferase UGT5-like [Schistocerca serialis cubense]
MVAVWSLCTLLCLAAPTQLEAAQVLGLFQAGGRSQWGLAETFLRALERRGHHVTAVTTFPSSRVDGNWTEILIPHPITGDFNTFEMLVSDFVGTLKLFSDVAVIMCHSFLGDENVQNLYRSGKKFDVVVLEPFPAECLLAFAHRFGAPVVALSTFVGTDWIADMVGNPTPYSYVPNAFLQLTTRMNFLERVQNTLAGIIPSIVRQLYYLPKLDEIVRMYLNDTELPKLSEIEKQISLLLINYHFTHGCPRPLVPNMVEVGGLHIKTPKALPEDIQSFLDGAESGAVYFSMGTNVRSSDWPEEKRAAFLRVFSRLEQRVLWKWEADSLPGQPPNVKIGKWLPQSDILAHKNVRAFITHGGLLSTQEATARGVPLVAIPVFLDQKLNVALASRQGYAVRLDVHNITEASIEWALTEVLTVPRYRERAEHLSRIFNDRPTHPLDEAVYWTEYVIRHQGAPHLRSAALHLSWYQYLLLDVVAALLLVFLVVSFVIRAVIRRLFTVTPHPTGFGSREKFTKKD